MLYPPVSTAHQCDVEESQQRSGAPLTGLNVAEASSQQRTSAPPTGLTGVVVARAAAIAAVAEKYGWPPEHASRVADAILDGASERGTAVTDPVKYVLGTVKRSPASWGPDARRWNRGSSPLRTSKRKLSAELCENRRPIMPDGTCCAEHAEQRSQQANVKKTEASVLDGYPQPV